MLSEVQLSLLQNYRDKSYIMSQLAQESSSFYSILRTIVNMPIIITSSIMTIINSSFQADEVKVPNIILNASTSLILALMNNLKLSEKVGHFRSLNLKYTKLLHLIEDKLINEPNEINKDDIKNIINQYDVLTETSLDFEFPNHIKNKIRKRYYEKKCLPNILNCDTNFKNNNSNSDLIFTNSIKNIVIQTITNQEYIISDNLFITFIQLN